MGKGVWSSLIRRFWKKWEARGPLECFYCHRAVSRTLPESDPLRATIDHCVPKSRGGRHNIKNWVVACFECNQRKADK